MTNPGTKVRIQKVVEDGDLFDYTFEGDIYKAYMHLSLLTGEIYCSIDYNPEIVSRNVFRGLILEYRIPTLKADVANRLMEEVAPKFQELLDEIDDVFRHGADIRIDFKDEETAYQLQYEIECMIEDAEFNPSDIYEEWSFEAYYEPCSLEDIGLSAQSTTPEIKEKAIEEWETSPVPLRGDSDDLFEFLCGWVYEEKSEF